MNQNKCDLLYKKLIACMIENTREGVWARYECKSIIEKFYNCSSSQK